MAIGTRKNDPANRVTDVRRAPAVRLLVREVEQKIHGSRAAHFGWPPLGFWMFQLAKVMGMEPLTSISVPVYSAWTANVTDLVTPCMATFPVAVVLITVRVGGRYGERSVQ